MNFSDSLSGLYDAALALVYPQACAACGVACVEARADAPACAGCWEATHIYAAAEAVCWKCGEPAGVGAPAAVAEAVRCRRCEGEEFTAVRACGPYEGLCARPF